MTTPIDLPTALRKTADRLDRGVRYEWGHVGRCNCGQVVQTLTELGAGEMYRAFGQELNEWSEHARMFCETSNSEVDGLFQTLYQAGLDHQAVLHLEHLSDPAVLRRMASQRPEPGRFELRRNDRGDAADYMRALASLTEERVALVDLAQSASRAESVREVVESEA